MNLERLKEAVEIVDRYMIGNVQPDKKRALETLKDLATSVLNAEMPPEVKVYDDRHLLQTTVRREVEQQNKMRSACLLAHTRILLEKEQELAKLKAENEKAKKIIISLKRGECWCEMAVGNPMVNNCASFCKEAKSFLEGRR